jgi:hypothetical protein
MKRPSASVNACSTKKWTARASTRMADALEAEMAARGAALAAARVDALVTPAV